MTSNIYRFVPASLSLIKDFHTVDERCVLVLALLWSRRHRVRLLRFFSRTYGLHLLSLRIHIDAHLTGIRFFYKLIHNTEGWDAP